MCDPVSLTMAATTAIGAAGSVASSMSAASAQKKQAANVQAWQREQQQMRNAEKVRQEQFRQEADVERMKTVEALDAPDQQAAQEAEQERLAAYMQNQDRAAETGGPISAADTELAQASSPTNSEDFRSDMAKKINEATKGARERIKAMATTASYGNSFGGLANRNQQLLEELGRGIDKFNEFRRGSLGSFGLEKAIDPVEVTGSTSALPELFSAAFQMGTQGLGNAYGARTTFPSAPATGVGQKVIGGDPWANLRKPGKLTAAKPSLF